MTCQIEGAVGLVRVQRSERAGLWATSRLDKAYGLHSTAIQNPLGWVQPECRRTLSCILKTARILDGRKPGSLLKCTQGLATSSVSRCFWGQTGSGGLGYPLGRKMYGWLPPAPQLLPPWPTFSATNLLGLQEIQRACFRSWAREYKGGGCLGAGLCHSLYMTSLHVGADEQVS